MEKRIGRFKHSDTVARIADETNHAALERELIPAVEDETGRPEAYEADIKDIGFAAASQAANEEFARASDRRWKIGKAKDDEPKPLHQPTTAGEGKPGNPDDIEPSEETPTTGMTEEEKAAFAASGNLTSSPANAVNRDAKHFAKRSDERYGIAHKVSRDNMPTNPAERFAEASRRRWSRSKLDQW